MNPQHSVILQSVRYKELCRLALQDFFFTEKSILGTGKMTQLVKCLHFKHGDLGPSPEPRDISYFHVAGANHHDQSGRKSLFLFMVLEG